MAVSPHFRNLFHQGLSSGEKHFRIPPGIDAGVFQIILDYLYGIDIEAQVEALGDGAAVSPRRNENSPRFTLDNLLDSATFLGLDDLVSKLEQFQKRREELAAAAAAVTAASATAADAAADAAATAAHPPPPRLTDASSESRDERNDDDDDDEDCVDDDNSDTNSLPTLVPLDLHQQSNRKRTHYPKPKLVTFLLDSVSALFKFFYFLLFTRCFLQNRPVSIWSYFL